MADNLKSRAREIMAQAYADGGQHYLASLLRHGAGCDIERKAISHPGVAAALLAVERALAESAATHKADKERLDYLDRMNEALNAHHGSRYGWQFVATGMVNRLFAGSVNRLDLNDQDGRNNQASSVRHAIDKARSEIGG